MSSILIKSAQIVNEGKTFLSDIYISNGRIEMIAEEINHPADQTIDARGLHLLPGLIDDQVHFRDPGLTYKADIMHYSIAAVAVRTPSFMEMANTTQNTLNQKLWQDKYYFAA